jgi:4a-hydroxytetrahydrobiopterin dehydratase
MKLTPDQITTRLADLPGWQLEHDAIVRELRFPDFASAFACMTAIAMAAEKASHHPEWSNVYNQVTIRLTTHDEGGVTERDLKLAHRINELAP